MTSLPPPAPVGAGLLAPLLPARVTVVDTFHDSAGAVLFPAEEALLTRAVPKRRQEFTTARHCARAALARLGIPPAPILPDPRGAPGWPEGIVGSLTHCVGYRAAAVAETSAVAALGIDAEPAEPLRDPDVLAMIADAGERAALDELAAGQPDIPWDRLLFSAKESVYKTWYPLTRQWLGFHEARVALDPDGTFTAALLVPGPTVAGIPLTGFTGRWRVGDGLAVTAVAVPAVPAVPPAPAGDSRAHAIR
ncbi:4'-phosphopantetheinyl transferase [Streptomyces sp. NPDC058280]|uniref:4'-phosphopantetheinyl transferase family protein n=1 Tax=Streptomyces sp. NPDC058280 TaxID=3346419 RepID=UPI0036EFD530